MVEDFGLVILQGKNNNGFVWLIFKITNSQNLFLS